jgi:hypothetical protein
MADFGESFLSAMQTGLSVARSYRDEARLNDQIKRQNRRDDLTEKLALSAEDRAAKLFSQQTEAVEYDKTLRPKREKALDLQLETGTLQNEGLKIDNQFKPERYRADIRQSNASANSANASAGLARAQTERVRVETDVARMGLDLLRNDRDTQTFISNLVNGSAPLGDVKKYEVPLLQFTGLMASASRAREVLGMTSRGDFSWIKDTGARMSIQNFLRPEASRSAAARGLDARSADVASFAPAKGGVAVNYSAFDRAGNLQVWQEVLPADKLFAKVDIAGGAASAFRNSPNAQNAAVAMYQRMSPEGYRKLASAAQESIDDKIESYRTAASKAANPSEKRDFEAKAGELERNRDRLVTDQIVNYLGITGNKVGARTSANRALVAIRQDAPDISDQEAATRAVAIRRQMATWRQNGTLSRLQQSGVLPGNRIPGTNPVDEITAYYAITGNQKALNILGVR